MDEVVCCNFVGEVFVEIIITKFCYKTYKIYVGNFQ